MLARCSMRSIKRTLVGGRTSKKRRLPLHTLCERCRSCALFSDQYFFFCGVPTQVYSRPRNPRKSLLDRLGVYPVLLDCLLYRVRHCIGFYDCLLDHNQKVSSDKFDVIETTRNSIWRFTQPETGKIRGPSATNQPDERGLAAPTPPVEPTLARTRPSRPAPFFASTLYIFIHLAGYNRTNM